MKFVWTTSKKAEDWIILIDKKYRKWVWFDLDKPVRPEEKIGESI